MNLEKINNFSKYLAFAIVLLFIYLLLFVSIFNALGILGITIDYIYFGIDLSSIKVVINIVTVLGLSSLLWSMFKLFNKYYEDNVVKLSFGICGIAMLVVTILLSVL